jgi:hypothetical protein
MSARLTKVKIRLCENCGNSPKNQLLQELPLRSPEQMQSEFGISSQTTFDGRP